MKVVCNMNTKIFNFTQGKIYEVKTEPHEYFFSKYITDDKGSKIQYSEYTKHWFKTLESLRQDRINEILK